MIPIIRVYPNSQAVAEAAAARIVEAVLEKLATDSGLFSLVLAGGSTPKAVYELLASEPYLQQLNWSRIEVFFGDERCVAEDHPDSNFAMARQALLDRVPIPEANIHRMRGEIEPQAAAVEYDQLLAQRFANAGPDLVLLGMGEDGHTLSLFPGTAAVDEKHRRAVANYAEKSTTGKSWRLTLTAPFVNRSAAVIVLVTGKAKAGRVSQVLEGPKDPQRQPIQLIEPIDGTMTWILDAAAAGMEE